jgi:exosortase B
LIARYFGIKKEFSRTEFMSLILSSSFGSIVRRQLQVNAPWLLGGLGLAILYLPTFYDLFNTIWATDEQGHGPIVLAISGWLIWRNWQALSTFEGAVPWPAVAYGALTFGALLYAFGRSQDILIFEVGSIIWMIVGLVLLLRGPRQLSAIWFALLFMLFMIPLPSPVVDALTQPMKMAVSYVATQVLHYAGYPIARSGVIIHIGQYQLLVADACAGLHTLFTLEALGLLYLNVVRSSYVLRNVTLAILIIPISFAANVIRVMILTLVTYYFGDAAGQGFIHEFAGMVLFMTALFLIIFTDTILQFVFVGKSTP